MSELKEVKFYEMNLIKLGLRNDKLYFKSEADKVIADLEESHKMEVEQLLMEIVELKKEKEYTLEHTTEVINSQERELRHSNYKRCLAMACKYGLIAQLSSHCLYAARRANKYAELADKFKEAK